MKVGQVANVLLAIYALDRGLKMAAVAHFFARKPPPGPQPWPGISLLQPITRGANLRATLWSRATLDYPAQVQHLFVCDSQDSDSQAVCKALLAEFPGMDARIVLVDGSARAASKTVKLQASISHATGEVICSIDDDIILRPDALRVLVRHLCSPGTGSVFGLACYVDWRNVPTSLMSAFVNANALLSYVPLTYLTEPFTITGHIFALERSTLDAIGGFGGLEKHIGDDHVTARNVRQLGLKNVQTPMIYDVDNYLPSMRAYGAQMKRWFVFPRQALLPYMTAKEQAISLAGSIGNLIPGLLTLIAIVTRKREALQAAGLSLGLFGAVYALCERLYLRRYTPLRWWPLVLMVALLTPLQIIGALLSDDVVEWRGKRLRILEGGYFEEVTG